MVQPAAIADRLAKSLGWSAAVFGVADSHADNTTKWVIFSLDRYRHFAVLSAFLAVFNSALDRRILCRLQAGHVVQVNIVTGHIKRANGVA